LRPSANISVLPMRRCCREGNRLRGDGLPGVGASVAQDRLHC
jgi:hypothetical protein